MRWYDGIYYDNLWYYNGMWQTYTNYTNILQTSKWFLDPDQTMRERCLRHQESECLVRSSLLVAEKRGGQQTSTPKDRTDRNGQKWLFHYDSLCFCYVFWQVFGHVFIEFHWVHWDMEHRSTCSWFTFLCHKPDTNNWKTVRDVLANCILSLSLQRALRMSCIFMSWCWLLMALGQVPQCGWRVASRSPAQWQATPDQKNNGKTHDVNRCYDHIWPM